MTKAQYAFQKYAQYVMPEVVTYGKKNSSGFYPLPNNNMTATYDNNNVVNSESNNYHLSGSGTDDF